MTEKVKVFYKLFNMKKPYDVIVTQCCACLMDFFIIVMKKWVESDEIGLVSRLWRENEGR